VDAAIKALDEIFTEYAVAHTAGEQHNG